MARAPQTGEDVYLSKLYLHGLPPGGDGGGGDGGGGGGGENVDVARVVDVGERERDLRAFCAKDLASHKVPRTFVFAEKIPRNAMGKVNKKTLRKAMFPTVDFSA